MSLITEPHNAYPNLPVQAFTRTTVSMDDVDAYIASLSIQLDVKDAVYMIFRNESGNGSHGVNDNYIGQQADGAPIGHGLDSRVIGTCVEPENGTHNTRRFCCFASWKDSVDIVVEEVTRRQLYIGGNVNSPYCVMQIRTIHDWVSAYYQDWVTGCKTAVAPSQYYTLFQSLFNDAQKLFTK